MYKKKKILNPLRKKKKLTLNFGCPLGMIEVIVIRFGMWSALSGCQLCIMQFGGEMHI